MLILSMKKVIKFKNISVCFKEWITPKALKIRYHQVYEGQGLFKLHLSL